jgi:energy-coupling factor transporter ATP-binding protein EcfA2
MKVRKLHIQNFRAIKDCPIRFEDALGRIRPVTVLAGPNGCGKTSVLFAIVQALRGVMGYRTDDVPEPSDSDIHSTGKLGGLSRTPPLVWVRLDLKFDEAEREAIPKVLEDTRDLHREPIPQAMPIIQDGNISVEWQYPPERNPDGSRKPHWYLSRVEPYQALSWLYGRKYAIRGWRYKKLRSRTLLDHVGGIYLFPQDRNLRSRVVGNTDNMTEHPDIGDVDNGFDEEHRRGKELPSVWGILDYLSGRSRRLEEPLKEEENWEKRIQEQFKRICAPKEYLGFLFQADDPIGAPYFKDGDSVYPLDRAASGEQVIIEYLTRLTYPSPMNHSLVLIDEPEVHLHPGWIRQLYRALPQMGVENQFILTTHSLELRAMAAEDGALIDMGEMEG